MHPDWRFLCVWCPVTTLGTAHRDSPLAFCMGKEWDIQNFDFFINKTKTPHVIYRREYTFFYFSQWFSDSSYLTFPLLAFIFTDNITFGICKQILMVRIADRPLCSLPIVGGYCSLQKNQDWVLLLYQCHSSAAHTAGTNAGPHFGMKAANQKKQWLKTLTTAVAKTNKQTNKWNIQILSKSEKQIHLSEVHPWRSYHQIILQSLDQTVASPGLCIHHCDP